MLPDFAEIFTRVSNQGDTNSVQRLLEKFKFLRNRRYPKFACLVQLWPPFSPLKMAKIEENKKNSEKSSAIRLSKYANCKTVSPLPFKWKIGLLFELFEHGQRLEGRSENVT